VSSRAALKLHAPRSETVQGVDDTHCKSVCVCVSLPRVGFQDPEAGADTRQAGPQLRAALEPGAFLAGAPEALHVRLACPPDVLVCSQRHDAHNSPRHRCLRCICRLAVQVC